MIIKHYGQLLIRYHRWVIWSVLLATVGSALLSWVWLGISPVYRATASVAMLPTEAEYAFGRETGSGPRATIRGLTATYIEYLKSRPVIETTLDRLNADTGQDPVVEPEPGFVERTVKSAIGFARSMYKTLDSGSYVPSTPRDRDVNRLVKAIRLHKVPDSYILRVEVSLENPQAAAAAANALAEAYVERISEQLETSTGQMEGFLHEQIRLREVALEKLIAREEALKEGLGALSLEEERQFVMRAREIERQKLVDAEVGLESIEAELGMLERENLAQSGRNLTELNEARAQAKARLKASRRSMELRQKSLRELGASLDALNAKEEPLLELSRQRVTMEAELSELNTRMLSTSLARSSAMTQVRVIDPARAPAYPSSPRVVVNTLAGGLVSLMAVVFLVILVDTVSGTVKTTPDLMRITGSRCLGELSESLLGTAPKSRWMRSKQSRQVSAVENQLALLGAFDAPAIQVTGFVDSARLGDVTHLLEARLGKLRPATVARRSAMRVLRSDAAVAVEQEDGPSEPARCFEELHPFSARVSLSEAARCSPAMICVVPAGKVAESRVEEFLQQSLASGLTGVGFLLLEP